MSPPRPLRATVLVALVLVTFACRDRDRGSSASASVGSTSPPLPAEAATAQGRPAPSPVVELALGLHFTCARLEDGTVHCWGEGTSGELGDGELHSRPRPAKVIDLPPAAHLAVGSAHACAATRDGAVYCWGHDAAASVDGGTRGPVRRPTAIPGVREATGIAGARGHAGGCAVVVGGEVRCWGDPSIVPVPASNGVTRLVLGDSTNGTFACAIMTDHSVTCWGEGEWGQLGDGTTQKRARPVTVPGIDRVVDIAAREGRVCVVREDGAILCWGRDPTKDHADESTCDVARIGRRPCRVRPHPVALRAASQIALGAISTCALGRDGVATCERIVGSDITKAGVRLVEGDEGRQCVVRLDGVVECHAGSNTYGELGDGTIWSSHPIGWTTVVWPSP